MAGGAYLVFTIAFPSMVGGSRTHEDRRRLDRIRASGDVLAASRTGGRIGGLRLSRPLVKAEVYPGGLVVSPFGLEPIGVPSESIVGVVVAHPVLIGSEATIDHRQNGVPEIRLLLVAEDPIIIALRSIAGSAGQPQNALPPPTKRAMARYSIEMKALLLIGFGLAVVFAFVAVPFGQRLGTFGLFWSIGIVAILVFNAGRFFFRDRDRW